MPTRYRDQNYDSHSLLDLIITIGLMVVILFTALAHGAVEPWSLATFSLLISALAVLWAIKSVIDRKMTFVLPSIALPVLALLGLVVLQSIAISDRAGKRSSISMDVEATRMSLEVLIVIVLALLLASNFLTGGQKLLWFRNFLIFFGLALAVFGLVQHFTWNGKYFWVVEPSVTPSAPFGPFVNHNHFAGYMELIAPIPAALILMRAVRGELTVLYGFAAVIMGVATFASLSRGGMISLIAGLMFVVAFGVKSSDQYDSGRSSRLPFRLPRVLMKSGSLVAIVVTIGVGVWWVGADPVIRRVEKGELSLAARPDDPRKETFFNSRGFIWSDTVSLIRDNWVTGVGFGAFQTAYPIYNRRDGTLLVSQAHNDYLQILADCGILGAIIALWFIYIVFRSTRQALLHRDPAMSGLALGCAGGLFAMLVHSLFDFNLQLPSNALLFLVLTSVVSQVADAAVEGRVRQSVPDRAVRLSVAA